MRDGRPSFTAATVAACRGVSDLLPAEARLVDDPYGLSFAGPAFEALGVAARWAPRAATRHLPFAGPLGQLVVWMQLRTRTIDDHIADFVRAGGRQVVLLGAGLDARALRLPHEGVRFFEVDHPATQRRKRQALARLGASPGVAQAPRFVAWDFETQALAALPATLAAEGLSTSRPTITIWEGVTMYLTEPAIEASLAAMRGYSGPGSRLVLTYFDSARLAHPPFWTRVMKALVAGAGEPFRFGWQPSALPAWMLQRGFEVVRDESDVDLVRRLLPPRYEPIVAERGSRVTLLRLT